MKLELLITLLGATYSLAQSCSKGAYVCCDSFKSTSALTQSLAGVVGTSGTNIGDMAEGQKTGSKCSSDLQGCTKAKLACCGLNVGGNYIDCYVPDLTPTEFAELTAQKMEMGKDGNYHPKKKHRHGGGGIPGLSGIADIPGL
ncbi:unnamed protein product [Cunninghamella blakesleeana]